MLQHNPVITVSTLTQQQIDFSTNFLDFQSYEKKTYREEVCPIIIEF